MNVLVKRDSINYFNEKFLKINSRDRCGDYINDIGNRLIPKELVKDISSFTIEMSGNVGGELKPVDYLVTFQVVEYDGLQCVLKEVKREIVEND